MAIGDSGVCWAKSEATAQSDVNVASKRKLVAELKLESRLITHWHAVEHVTRRRAFAVSLGAFRNVAKRPRVEDPCSHGRRQRPFIIRIDRDGQDRTILHGDCRRLWRLVNSQGKNRRTNQHGAYCDWVGSKR